MCKSANKAPKNCSVESHPTIESLPRTVVRADVNSPSNADSPLVALKRRIGEYFAEFARFPPTEPRFYQIVKQIGRGSFGRVYLALQRLTGRLVAVKLVDKSGAKGEARRRKVFAEATTLARLEHPRIVRLLEVFEDARFVFVVMEYAPRGDLLHFLNASAPIGESRARDYFAQIATAIAYLHHKRVLHRDIKLDNVLLDERGQCKVCDFGVSRVVYAGESMREQCGTPAYASPEIVLNRGYAGFSTDIWSLGVVLYALLCGALPFAGRTLDELNARIVEGRFELPPKIAVSAAARELLASLLQVDPARRPTAGEILAHVWLAEAAAAPPVARRAPNSYVLGELERLGLPREIAAKAAREAEPSHAFACYYLLERDVIEN